LNTENEITQKYMDMIISNKMVQFITLPTRVQNNTSTLIDHVYLSENLFKKNINHG